jgi:multicomponent Na+:H+ antiporter subunit E
MTSGMLEAIGLAFLWVFVTGNVTVSNLMVGSLLGYVVLMFAERVPGFRNTFGRLWKALTLLLYFFWELVVSNLKVAYVVASPRFQIEPGVVGVPLDVRTDAEITLLANLITLTPGTMSLEVSDDRRVLYVHGIDVRDREAFIRAIKDGFEKRVLEVLR